jgi:lathosterol oxidase
VTPRALIGELPIVWLINVCIDLARYLLVAGTAFVVFWIWGCEHWQSRLIQGVYPQAEKLWHDVRWSMSTVIVFSAVGVAIYYAGRAGVLRRYEDVAAYGWGWFGVTIVLLIVLQDTYFYWTHRAMHHRRLYRAVHRRHHRSTNPSPWTAYAFSPIEALVHALFVPLVWLVVPMHDAAVFVFLAFMIVRNVLGHLSIELFSPGFARGRFSGWHTTATHHALHHRRFATNYGLYFTLWDRLMGTTDPHYEPTFERIASGAALDRPLATAVLH